MVTPCGLNRIRCVPDGAAVRRRSRNAICRVNDAVTPDPIFERWILGLGSPQKHFESQCQQRFQRLGMHWIQRSAAQRRPSNRNIDISSPYSQGRFCPLQLRFCHAARSIHDLSTPDHTFAPRHQSSFNMQFKARANTRSSDARAQGLLHRDIDVVPALLVAHAVCFT